jgi:CheY-like chemotaxis protein
MSDNKGLARILWVDENLDNVLEYHVKCLLKAGYIVDEALAVEDGVRLLKSRDYDLVILDLLMPGGSVFTPEETKNGANTGLLLYRKMRTINNSVPFLIFSAIVNESLGEETRDEISAKVDGVLSKSVRSSPDILLIEVERILRNRSKGK